MRGARFRSIALVALFAASSIPARPAPPAKQLKILRPLLQQFDGGPPLPVGTPFLTGDVVFLSFQIAGYEVSPESKVDLAYTVEAVDPDGVPVVEPAHGNIATQVSAEDKNWLPIVRESVPLARRRRDRSTSKNQASEASCGSIWQALRK